VFSRRPSGIACIYLHNEYFVSYFFCIDSVDTVSSLHRQRELLSDQVRERDRDTERVEEREKRKR
jgi:hypothetical protein